MDDLLTTEKAANYSARAGQTIAGNLARGGDGKFTSAGNATARAPGYTKPKGTSRSILVKRRDAKGKGGKKAAAKKPTAGTAPKSAEAVEREQIALQSARERLADQRKRRAERDADRAQRAQDRAKREVDKVGQQAQAAAKVAARKAEIERRRQERQAKGGGGGGKAKPKDKAVEQAANRATVQAATLDKAAFDAFTSLAEGGDADPAQVDALVTAGLVERDTQGGTRVSAAGRSYLVAANSGDVGRARDAMSRAVDRAAAPAKRKEAPGFAVYKDAKNRYRWVTVSSTAFRDRDGEIVSVEALKEAAAYMNQTSVFGPLRWWHMPGVDIGDCDFSQVVSKCLVESGTFRNERIGAAFAQKAHDHQISIGYLHARNQPDLGGVFSRIRIFERSPTPAGRASNPFTRLTVKDADMAHDADKMTALKELIGDDLLDQLLAGVATTEKDALAAGVAFKAEGDTPPPAEGAMPEDEPTAEAEDDAGLFTAEELQTLAAALAPLLVSAMTGATTKAAGEIAEVKGEVVAVKSKTAELDAAIASAAQAATDLRTKQAELAAAEAALDARLKELESDQPQGYRRPSQDPANTLTAEQVAQKQYTAPGKTALDSQVDFMLNPAA